MKPINTPHTMHFHVVKNQIENSLLPVNNQVNYFQLNILEKTYSISTYT